MSRNNRLLANRYEIEKVAGRGGTSVVYKAYDLQAERAVRAIKEISKSNIDVYDMAKLESALIKELYELDKTNAFFPNIIHRFETENNFYIVQDYLDGESMDDILKSGPMTEKMFLEAAKQICSFMEFFHNTGRVYSDMKPENIMVLRLGDSSMNDGAELKLKFIDFGTAIKNSTGVTGYTPEYAAPEQYRNDMLDNRTDIFNIGATLYHMILGRKPLKVSSGSELLTSRERFIFDRKINPDIKRIIQKCVADEPSKRYHSCKAIYKDICRIERKTSIRLVASAFVLSLTCFIGAGAFALIADHKAMKDLHEKYTEYVNKGNYAEAIKIDHTNRDGIYIALIESFKNDLKLDAEEDNYIINEIQACDSIKESDSDYGECMYEIAYAYWLYYDPYENGGLTDSELERARNEKAYRWFGKAVRSKDPNADFYEKAKILFSACRFYTEIDKIEKEGKDNPQLYTDMWNNIKDLSMYIDEGNDVVSARVCQMLMSLISRNSAKFRINGVEKREQTEILDKIYFKVYNEDHREEDYENDGEKKVTYSNVSAIEIAEMLHFKEAYSKVKMVYDDVKER